jgi:hypothetical protein
MVKGAHKLVDPYRLTEVDTPGEVTLPSYTTWLLRI